MSLPDSEKPSPLYSNQDLSSKSSTLEGSIKEGLSEHDSASIHDDSEYNLTPGISPAAPVPLGEPLSRKATSVQTAGTNSPDFEVDYEENDPLNPREWPIWYKGVTIGFISWSTWVYEQLSVHESLD